MPFDFAKRDEDPGLPPLHPDRLAAGGSIDVQIRRRNHWPERVMRRIHIAFWAVFWLLLGFVVTATIWVQQ